MCTTTDTPVPDQEREAASTETQKIPTNPSVTQENVPQLIQQLYQANVEIVQPSEGPAIAVENDPHLRLRRTLTPSLNLGLKRYNEAQFMIQGSSGKRIPLSFTVEDIDGQKSLDFTMDAYVWGASEAKATRRVIAIHGISPGVSRTRWHSLGERLAKSEPNLRFVALDWHSIDRSPDQFQSSFLTLLPKHIFSTPSEEAQLEFLDKLPAAMQDKARGLFDMIHSQCPRPTSDGVKVLSAIIQDGLGWGSAANKKFFLAIKSWSGSIGIEFLKHATKDREFEGSIDGLVAMHPACFSCSEEECKEVMMSVPETILCWARDDNKAPFFLSEPFVASGKNVKLVAYEKGGHHNFDGSGGLPNFDIEVEKWLQEI